MFSHKTVKLQYILEDEKITECINFTTMLIYFTVVHFLDKKISALRVYQFFVIKY